VLTGLPVFVWVALNRQWHTLWQTLPWVRGTALMLLIALPWYILAELKTPGFFDYFIIGEHFKRFLVSGWEGDLYGSAHDRARGTIWLYLLQASFPWGLIAAAAWAWSLLRKQSNDNIWHTQYPGLTTMLIAAALTPAVFFTFSGNVLWTYILPGLPFLAILTAGLLQRNGKPSLTKFALASSLAIPILGTAAGAWFAANPGKLKTERELIRRIDAMPGYSPADLFYLDEAPFSARFYTQGQVNTVGSNILKNRIASDYWVKGKLFAEMKGGQSVIEQLKPSAQLIDSSRRYKVYQLGPVANKLPDLKTAPKGQ